MTRDEQLDYLAGMFDGDGCISASCLRKKHGHPDHPRYPIRAVVQMTCESIPLMFQREFGGSISAFKGRTSFHKPTWMWMHSLLGKSRFLEIVGPRLILKKEVAALTIELCARLDKRWSRKPGFMLPVEETNVRRSMVLSIQELNQATCSDSHQGYPNVPYLSGFFDAEGSVGTRSNARQGSRGVGIGINVSNQCRWILGKYKDLFGGYTRQTGHVYQWMGESRIGYAALKAMAPFLTVKLRQAEMAIALGDLTGGRPGNLSNDVATTMRDIRAEIMRLNAA